MQNLVSAHLFRMTRGGVVPVCVVAYALCLLASALISWHSPDILTDSLASVDALQQAPAAVGPVPSDIPADSTGTSSSASILAAWGATLGGSSGLPWFACLALAAFAAEDFSGGAVKGLPQLRGGRTSFVPAHLAAFLAPVACLLGVGLLASWPTFSLAGIQVVGVPWPHAAAWLAQLMLVTLAYAGVTLLAVALSGNLWVSLIVALVVASGSLEQLAASALVALAELDIAPQFALGTARALATASPWGILQALSAGQTAGAVGFVVPVAVFAAAGALAVLVVRRRELTTGSVVPTAVIAVLAGPLVALSVSPVQGSAPPQAPEEGKRGKDTRDPHDHPRAACRRARRRDHRARRGRRL